MKKYISTFEIGESEYKLKDSEVRTDLGTHESNTVVHVTAEEKAYWNSKVNPPSFSAPTAKSLTYTGEAQDLLNAGSATAGTIQYSSDETNWSTTIPQGTNAGTHTAYWRFIGSESVYIDSTAIEVTIAKANPTYTAPTARSLTYNGEAQILNNDGSTNYGTLKYSLDDENWSASAPTRTDAGDYTVYYKVFGDDNVNDTSVANISCSIDKVTPTVTAPTAKVLTYSGEALTLLNAGSTNYGTLKYSDDGATYDTTIPSATNANTYTIYYRVDGDSNINNVAATSVNCTISKVTPTVTAPTPKTLTYNAQAQVLANTGSTDFGTLQYSSSENGAYSTDIPSETAANVTYYVWYRVIGDSNINNVSPASIECMIAEKRVTTPTITLDQDSYVYSGNANQPIPTVEDGGVIVNPTEYTVEYLNNVNAGEGTVIIVDKTAGNYYIEGTTVFAITKATPSYTAPININPTYTGSAQNILTSGSTLDGTIQYSLDDSTWDTTIPQLTNAGTYTAYWKLVGDSNHTNVSSTSVTCTIAKADPSYTAPTAKSLTYSGSAQALLNAGSTSDGTIQYSSDNSTWSTTIPTGTSTNTYTSYWRIVGDNNHNDKTSASISTTISKANGSVTTAPTAKSLTYNGNAQILANAGSGTGTMYYRLGTSGDFSTTIPSQTNAGSWTLYYYAAASNDYNQSNTGSITVSISKANQNAPTATGATTTYPTIATATASGGGGVGSIEWENSQSQTSVGFHTTRARWTGNDNYNASPWSDYVTVQMNKANRTASFENANGYDYVELHGIKWATKNVGASSIADYGDYYKYGLGSSVYNTSQSNYTGTDYTLPLSYDTARQVMGGTWRTPTKNEFIDLQKNTTFSYWYSIEGVERRAAKFTDANGNYIYLPCGGYYTNGSNGYIGYARYQTSSLFRNQNIKANFWFQADSGTDMVYADAADLSYGLPVRGILDKSYKSLLKVGDTDTIQVFTTGNPTITLSSSNTNVATVNGMTVTATGVGTAVITATVAGDSNYNSTSINYTLTVRNQDGIYAIYSDGSLKAQALADNNALGVAIILNDCSFIIGKTLTQLQWDSQYSSNGKISGCQVSGAFADISGKNNTDAIVSKASGVEAAKYCRQQSMTIGGTVRYGYLGGFGEYVCITLSGMNKVNSMMTTIGGTSLLWDSSTNKYWASTQQSSSNAYVFGVYKNNGSISLGRAAKNASFYVRELYPLYV